MKAFKTLIAVALLAFPLGCSDSSDSPVVPAPTPTLLVSRTYTKNSLSPSLLPTNARYEFTVGIFENPRTDLIPDYVLFDGYSYSAGDAGRIIVIRNPDDDEDFVNFVRLLVDGERNTMLIKTQRVDGSSASILGTDTDLAQTAGLETEDLTNMTITQISIHIVQAQVYHDSGDTIEAVEWCLEIYGY